MKTKVDVEGSCYSWWYICEECHGQISSGIEVCPYCKSELDWSDIILGFGNTKNEGRSVK